MTTDTTAAPRANRNGDPCPAWCATDHDQLLIDGQPELGYMDGHYSDLMDADSGTAVKVHRWPGRAAVVHIRWMPENDLTLRQAEVLAAFLEKAPADMGELIGQLRTAAAMIRFTA